MWFGCPIREVDSKYQLALEIAAGSRLGYIVVEDDNVAALAIQLLKQQKAGRATFLPLNKINPPPFIYHIQSAMPPVLSI